MILQKMTINHFKSIEYPDTKIVRNIDFFLLNNGKKASITSEAVHYVKQLLLENNPENSKNFMRATSCHYADNPIDFEFDLSFLNTPFTSFFPEELEFPEALPAVNHIKLRLEIAWNESTKKPNIKTIKFIVNHELFFKVRSLSNMFTKENFKKRFHIFGHDMVPEELIESWQWDNYLEGMENDCCETCHYDGYDTDLTEDWSGSYDDFESDAFLDNGSDEEYGLPYSYPDTPDRQDDVHEDDQSCWKYYDTIQHTLLPPPPQDLKIIKESDPKDVDHTVDILSSSYETITEDDIFFNNVIMQFFSGTIEILRNELGRTSKK
jgi:hypothetical protein